jgi:hypothetical protein
MNGKGMVEPRKVGEFLAECANVKRSYWHAPQELEGIFLDGELYQAAEYLYGHAMNKPSLSGLSGLSSRLEPTNSRGFMAA